MTALWPDGLRRTENTKTRTQIHPHHVHLYTFKKYQWVHETNSIRILILTKATAFLCKSKLMNEGTYKKAAVPEGVMSLRSVLVVSRRQDVGRVT